MKPELDSTYANDELEVRFSVDSLNELHID